MEETKTELKGQRIYHTHICQMNDDSAMSAGFLNKPLFADALAIYQLYNLHTYKRKILKGKNCCIQGIKGFFIPQS